MFNEDFVQGYHKLLASYSANSLSLIGDNRAITPIIEAMKYAQNILTCEDNLNYRAWHLAAKLARFESPDIDPALVRAKEKGNIGAAIALAWRNGGKDLEVAEKMAKEEEYKDIYYNEYLLDDFIPDELGCARLKWGEKNYFVSVINYLAETQQHSFELLNLVLPFPDFFPPYNPKAKRRVRRDQAKALVRWYEKNEDRITWDADKRKYYLKPE